MDDLITSARHKGYELKLYYGENMRDPREFGGSLGKMLCYHPMYDLLGDFEYRRINYPTIEKLMEELLDLNENKNTTDIIGYLPLYLYEHSGMSIHWDYNHFNDKFDTRRIGFYIFTKNDVEDYSEEYVGCKDDYIKEVGMSLAKKEIIEYDKYLSGSITVIDYMIIDPEGVVIDSCAGYLLGEKGLTKEVIGMIIDDIHFEDESIDMTSFKEVMSERLLACI